MANAPKLEHHNASRTGGSVKQDLVATRDSLHEASVLTPRTATRRDTAIARPPGVVDVARALERDHAGDDGHAAGRADLGAKEVTPLASGADTPSTVHSRAPSESDCAPYSMSTPGDSAGDAAVGAAYAPVDVVPVQAHRWASRTLSTAPGRKRMHEDDDEDALELEPAVKRRQVQNDAAAGSSQLDAGRVESSAPATRDVESFYTTAAHAAVEPFENADEKHDEDDDTQPADRPMRSVRGRPPTPYRPRRSTRARKSNAARAQSVEAVSVHTPPHCVQPVPRTSAVDSERHRGTATADPEQESLLALAARFFARLDGKTVEAEGSGSARAPSPKPAAASNGNITWASLPEGAEGRDLAQA
ncbi:hypothetical protein AURDEDRAFT_125549 [Auricularia subglabra TFB-10046 SS5]|nr:hypothetical protein AURDEDRAFT_125549 [Auricularia subglabra TFB-10046 SS5]